MFSVGPERYIRLSEINASPAVTEIVSSGGGSETPDTDLSCEVFDRISGGGSFSAVEIRKMALEHRTQTNKVYKIIYAFQFLLNSLSREV